MDMVVKGQLVPLLRHFQKMILGELLPDNTGFTGVDRREIMGQLQMCIRDIHGHGRQRPTVSTPPAFPEDDTWRAPPGQYGVYRCRPYGNHGPAAAVSYTH